MRLSTPSEAATGHSPINQAGICMVLTLFFDMNNEEQIIFKIIFNRFNKKNTRS